MPVPLRQENGNRRRRLSASIASMPEIRFDERIAATYDATSTEMFAPAVVDATVGFLADLAGAGAALEFAVGTGRIALPLAERGVRVHGIDISPPMVQRMRA